MPPDQLRTYQAGDLSIRADVAKRQIILRLFTWDTPAPTPEGPELIERGALAGLDPVSLVLRMDHLDPPIGRGVPGSLVDGEDGPYVTFQASRTARADEGLELAADGTYSGASVGFVPRPFDGYRTINGQRVGVRKTLDVREASLTWRPIHEGSAIIAIRSQEGADMPPDQDPAAGAANSPDAAGTAAGTAGQAAAAAAAGAGASGAAQLPQEGTIVQLLTRMSEQLQTLNGAFEERARKMVDVPPGPGRQLAVRQLLGHWVHAAATYLDGDKVPELELRALADVTTADNLGVVPKNIRDEVLGIIDPARPFLESTRQVDPGESGMTQTFPRVTQRPLADVQAAEKDELASRTTIIGTVDFGVTSIGGAGDLSIQLLKRSSPAFLNLWFELLAEAYAIKADDKAVDALLASGVIAGTGAFDPETFKFGEAFTNSAAVSPSLRLRPDRMWLSTAAFVSMIDARTPAGGGGTPMYPGLIQIDSMTPSNSEGGPKPIRLRPVLVPALDDEAVDVVIGPSAGFAWAEDGTYKLEADNPGQAGRDVGLVGMIWYMPVYPGAFTTYALAP